MQSHPQGVLPFGDLAEKVRILLNFKERTKSDGIEIVEKDLMYVITGNMSYFLTIFVPPEFAHLYMLK